MKNAPERITIEARDLRVGDRLDSRARVSKVFVRDSGTLIVMTTTLTIVLYLLASTTPFIVR